MLPQTLDDVLEELDDIIAICKRDVNVAGYFAALYRRVTAHVQQGIVAGRFEDGRRMERLDVNFANRYIEAWRQYEQGETPTKSWHFAFRRCDKRQGLVLQHLLLGMNAHINLDLAIAAAKTAPGAAYPPLQRDFDEINQLLAELFDDVQASLSKVSSMMHLVRSLSHKQSNDVLLNFSMRKARTAAWQAGLRLSKLSKAAQIPVIDALDQDTTLLAEMITMPSMELTIAYTTILLAERWDIVEIIEIIAGDV